MEPYKTTPQQNISNLSLLYRSRRTPLSEKLGCAIGTGIFLGALAFAGAIITSPSREIRNLPMVEYTISLGDTYHSLSERFIRDQHEFEKSTITGIVQDINKTPAGKLQPGQVILLPVKGLDEIEVMNRGGRSRSSE